MTASGSQRHQQQQVGARVVADGRTSAPSGATTSPVAGGFARPIYNMREARTRKKRGMQL